MSRLLVENIFIRTPVFEHYTPSQPRLLNAEEMIGLLDLPLEIRLKILEFVIHTQRCPPLEYSKDETRVKMADNGQMHGWFFGIGVYCEADQQAYRSAASKLQAINRQFKEEIQALFKNSLVRYKLDLAIMQGNMLWPTWTSIPLYRSTADIIEVKIRVAGPGRPCVRIQRGWDGGTPLWIWWFYSVLEHFFTIGVTPQRVEDCKSEVKSGRKQLMAVKILDLDFIEPLVPYDGAPKCQSSSSPDHSADDQNELTTDCIHCRYSCHSWVWDEHQNWEPRSLYIQLVRMFFLLLKPNLLHYGDVLYRGVETIRFRFKGDVKYELDIAELLGRWAMLSNGPEGHDWLEKTYAVREKFGLKNLERVQPHDCTLSSREISTQLTDALARV